MIFSESNSNIAAALAKSWAAIRTPKHNKTVKVTTRSGSSYTFEYTDFAGILDAVRSIFIENKLTIMQNSYTQMEHDKVFACVETIILHESGEFAKSYPLKFLAAQNMQDFGGQITYMKRYSLASALGIATEKDDDANGMSGNDYQYEHQQPRQQSPQKQQPTGLITQQQLQRLDKVLLPLAESQGMSADTLYNNSLLKCKIAQKPSNQLTTQEASVLINYLDGVAKTVAQRAQKATQGSQEPTEQDSQQQPNKITPGQYKDLKAVLNAASTRTKMDKDGVLYYAKMQLGIEDVILIDNLSQDQAAKMIDLISKIPAANTV
ncbi:ERF family protein [Bacillus ndiopicus]|uniref:ERF family protein n=1 Tax=Bacillus ndiopicus TaxID=1347368 RepID=UPI0006933698|nr:ERF family protein [Bacillus ndiopicus]